MSSFSNQVNRTTEQQTELLIVCGQPASNPKTTDSMYHRQRTNDNLNIWKMKYLLLIIEMKCAVKRETKKRKLNSKRSAPSREKEK